MKKGLIFMGLMVGLMVVTTGLAFAQFASISTNTVTATVTFSAGGSATWSVNLEDRTGGGSSGIRGFNKPFGKRGKWTQERQELVTWARTLLNPYMTGVVGDWPRYQYWFKCPKTEVRTE